MNDCKNCKYTDEYCASGDCNKIQSNNLACNKISLTEQWKKGELPEGHYYIKTGSETNIDEYIQWYKDHGIPSEKSFAYFNVQQVLAEVPDYVEWRNMVNCACEEHEANKRLIEENAQLKEILERHKKATAKAQIRSCDLEIINAQLKELLKECELWFTGVVGNMNDKNVGEHNKSVPIGNFEYIFKVFSQKINEVLK